MHIRFIEPANGKGDLVFGESTNIVPGKGDFIELESDCFTEILQIHYRGSPRDASLVLGFNYTPPDGGARVEEYEEIMLPVSLPLWAPPGARLHIGRPGSGGITRFRILFRRHPLKPDLKSFEQIVEQAVKHLGEEVAKDVSLEIITKEARERFVVSESFRKAVESVVKSVLESTRHG